MKKYISLFLAAVIVLPLFAQEKGKDSTEQKETTSFWDETGQDKELVVRHGIPAYDGMTVSYRRDGKSLLDVELQAPVVVTVASKPEGWGPCQFPTIYRSSEGLLAATWHQVLDHASGYGKEPAFMLSSDNGKTWNSSSQPVPPYGAGALFLPETGEHISIRTPTALKVSELQLPQPVGTHKDPPSRNLTFYRLNELPTALQGVYLNRWDRNGVRSAIHAGLDDPKAVRYSDVRSAIPGLEDPTVKYSDDPLFPVVWWGDMKLLPDNSIVAGIYPAIYELETGGVDRSGISFYKSVDNGMNWKISGKIPNRLIDPNLTRPWLFNVSEPAFEILPDGTFLCVMRVEGSPMYLSRSSDQGMTWSHPVPFTPNGVLPRLLQLDNGVLVLTSGRPGVQLRFSLDGKGEKWTDPFDMLPFMNEKGDVSCGYTGILATGPDRFLMIYSDFKYPNQDNELRKAIKIREIIVTKKHK